MDSWRPKLAEGERKNQIQVMFKGGSCEIIYQRKEGLFVSNVLITQKYSFIVDPKTETLKFPEKLSLIIDGPKEEVDKNQELSDLLYDIPLVMKSLNFPIEPEIRLT